MTFGEFRPLFGTTKSDWNFEFACSPSVTPEGDDNRSPSVSRFVTSTASSTPSISETQIKEQIFCRFSFQLVVIYIIRKQAIVFSKFQEILYYARALVPTVPPQG